MEQDYKLELLQKIGEVIMTYGPKSLNMDDIARHLSVSKKTLYKHFKDKNDIIHQIMQLHIEMDKNVICQILDASENAIDEMIKISQFVNEQLKTMHPSVMFDLQKYYPESYGLFTKHKDSYVLECIKVNLQRGIDEGLYRENVNVDLIGSIFVSIMENIWSADNASKNYSFSQVHTEMIRYHVRGVASEKGIQYLQERIKKELLNL